MARILADGSVNRKGRTYFIWVLFTEAGVFCFPLWYARKLNRVNFAPDNTMNHALSCYFPFELVCKMIIWSAVAGMIIGVFNTEIITSGDTYIRGLAHLQEDVVLYKCTPHFWLRFHKITQLHTMFELGVWMYTLQELARLDENICSPEFVRSECAKLLWVSGIVMFYRLAQHILLPLCRSVRRRAHTQT